MTIDKLPSKLELYRALAFAVEEGKMKLSAQYRDRFEPVFPCRELETRHCPAIYESTCGDRPCARLESRDETPWLYETGTKEMIKDEE